MLLFWTIFIASLLGSLHCAGMCGAFVLFAIGAGEPNVGVSRGVLQMAYHGGRLITYTLLGVAAGALGATLNLAGKLAGLQHAAAMLAGAMMIGFGVLALLQLLGSKWRIGGAPAFMQKLASMGFSKTAKLSPIARAGTVGLLTTLLPCGWLWAFVITAAGTASPVYGGLAMVAFWAGTLPVLVGLSVGVQKLAGRFASKVPVIASVAIVLVGAYTIYARSHVDLANASARHAGTQPSLKELTEEVPECCRGKATTQEARP